jgi:hypothetical protein
MLHTLLWQPRCCVVAAPWGGKLSVRCSRSSQKRREVALQGCEALLCAASARLSNFAQRSAQRQPPLAR